MVCTQSQLEHKHQPYFCVTLLDNCLLISLSLMKFNNTLPKNTYTPLCINTKLKRLCMGIGPRLRLPATKIFQVFSLNGVEHPDFFADTFKLINSHQITAYKIGYKIN